MQTERVRTTVADHVATVTLSRPEKHNALDAAMFAALGRAARVLHGAPGVRVVVLHGEGESFCSGLDVASFDGDLAGEIVLARQDGERANGAQRLCTDWIDLPVPVIAAVYGNCFGGRPADRARRRHPDRRAGRAPERPRGALGH